MARLVRASLLFTAVLAALVFPTNATSCPAGSVSPTGQAPCTQCEPGTYEPGQSSTDRPFPHPSPAHPARHAGQRSCRSAQAGWYAPGHGATSQAICAQGTFSTGGAASCTACPAGSYCNGQGQTRPVLCPKGHYSPTAGLGQQCLECPRGTFVAVEGATACCSCCSGFYNDQTSQDHCFACPVRGAFSPVGATSSSQCAQAGSGGLGTCAMSGNSCPATGGSFPSGKKRSVARRERPCAPGQQSCPVYSYDYHRRGGGGGEAAADVRGHECVDVQNDLESCGGCVGPDGASLQGGAGGGGRDCSAIPDVDSVRCRRGVCVIGRCARGYSLSLDGARCVHSLSVQAMHGRSGSVV
ncbi:hypothetical protein BC628DRAFT_1520755 [Trametes gibbosa]|nr:hypothetical protein BC628DRAFT_1520755 [Trametes gibbosa]